METQVINSLLDLDAYKINMLNAVYLKGHYDVPVKYVFKNRTKNVDLGSWISLWDLKQNIDHVMTLKFTKDDLYWLESLGLYSPEFINVLGNIELSKPEIITERGKFSGLEISGSWGSTILWETILLSIVNQLFNKEYVKYNYNKTKIFDDNVMLSGVSRLEGKIELLKQNSHIKISEFGTRRRFSREWQKYVIKRLFKEVPKQLLGTSNMLFAYTFGLNPIGTIAHEMHQAYAGIYNDDLVFSQNKLLEDWYDIYGYKGSIFLPDTFGTDFMLRTIDKNNLSNGYGFRQDSGDPYVIGDKIIQCYENNNIDPLDKIIIFSDGLTIPKIIDIDSYFSGRINRGYGIGTDMTNDLGVCPLSIVIKLDQINGNYVPKLSDNIAKAVGRPEDIEKYKQLVGYDSDFDQAPKY